MDEKKQTPAVSGKVRKKRVKRPWKYDNVISKLRTAKIPVNQTKLKEVALDMFVEHFTDETGHIDYAGIALLLSEEKIKEKVKNL